MERCERSAVDMHDHLGWFRDPVAVARAAAARELGMLAVTVTPEEFLQLRPRLAGIESVRLAVGLHPWWVRDATDADTLCELVGRARFVGEIGLDASPRRASNWDAQLAAFERICAACASNTAEVISSSR